MSVVYRFPSVHEDYGGQVFNLKHPTFGAKGDGVTDDTAAVAAWIAQAGNGLLYAPTGVYLTDTTSITTQNVLIRGAGRERTVFKSRTGTTVFSFPSGSVHSICFEDLTVRGNGGAGHGIHLGTGLTFPPSNFTLNRVILDELGGIGFFDEKGLFQSSFLNVDSRGGSDHHIDLFGSNTICFVNCSLKDIAAGKVGWRVQAGSPTFTSCNGVNGGTGAGAKMVELGSRSIARAVFMGCNFEDVDGTSVHLMNGSVADFWGRNSFLTGSATNAVAIKQESADAAAESGVLGPACVFDSTGGSWADGVPIHTSSSAVSLFAMGPRNTQFRDDLSPATRTLPFLDINANISGSRAFGTNHMVVRSATRLDTAVGFFGTVPVGQQNVPATSPTVQDVIDALVASGLVEQSD